MTSPASVQLFSGLRENDIRAIEAAAARRKFEAFRIIVRANEPAKSLFLVKAGCLDYYVTTEAGRDILLRRLAAGDVFGVGSLLSSPMGYIGTAKAVQHI